MRTDENMLGAICASLGIDRDVDTDFTMAGDLPSVFQTTALAASSIAAAGMAASRLARLRGVSAGAVCIDRRLASMWFGLTFRAVGWEPPPVWDSVAGDYACGDGWIRLHTNAPHHRAAAISVLRCAENRDAVAADVSGWDKAALEDSVVGAGGCAAAMHSAQEWRAHAQGRAVMREPLVAWEMAGAAGDLPLPGEKLLSGIRILDLTRILAGPVATRFLAGLGADVLRIDPPDWDEGATIPEVTLGKRCARLDLKTQAGIEQLKRLLGGADILVHGYRSDALQRLGLGEAERRAINPGLVDVCLNAYGWSGPWARRRGFDSLVQMSSGIAHEGMVRAGRQKPFPLPVQALDQATGYLMAAAALHGLALRITNRRGFAARLSLARTAAFLMEYPADMEAQPPFAAEAAGDFQHGIEHSDWGAIRRLRPPLSIGGLEFGWDRPAGKLGASHPCW